MKKAPKRSIRTLDNRQLAAAAGGQGAVGTASLDQGTVGNASLDQGIVPGVHADQGTPQT